MCQRRSSCALAAAWAPELRLGVAIIPAYTRGPGCLASSVAALADAAPGRFVLGLGSSSNVIVERWNDIPFEKPYQRTRDVLRFLRAAVAGEKIKEDYETFWVKGYRLNQVPEQQPPIRDVRDRMLFIEALETAKCFEEGVVTSAAAANIGSIMGIGFPALTGGAAQFMTGWQALDETGHGVGPVGLQAFLDRMDWRGGAARK